MGYDAEPGTPNFEPWATTNMDYGKFYNSFHKPDQVKKTATAHAECEKKYEALLKELMECKAQLEQLRHEPTADDRSHRSASPNSSRRSPSPRLSDIHNGVEQSTLPDTLTENLKDSKDSKSTKKPTKQQKLPRDKKTEALYRLARPKTAPPRHLEYLRSSRGRPEGAHAASKNYDYYKYFGTAGQGAKTSWGHNMPLGHQPPYSLRTQAPPNKVAFGRNVC